MLKERYLELLRRAFHEDKLGNPALIEHIAEVLEMQDRAKEVLRDKGYGCTGNDLLGTVRGVPHK